MAFQSHLWGSLERDQGPYGIPEESPEMRKRVGCSALRGNPPRGVFPVGKPPGTKVVDHQKQM